MKPRRIASIDQDTGEVLEGVVVYCGVKQNPYSKGWVMNSQEALELLASDQDLTKESLRVLMFLMARLDFENWIQVTQIEISEKLGIKKPNISTAISLLEKKGIILRGPKIGRTYAFRLNPYFGWKGKVKNLNDYRREEDDRERREFRERHLKAVESTTSSDDSE
jgi:DNA-binding transcriptional ArsR family regulator